MYGFTQIQYLNLNYQRYKLVPSQHPSSAHKAYFQPWKAALTKPLLSYSFLLNCTEIVPSADNKNLDFARLK